MFKAAYGEEMDPTKYRPDMHIWDTIEEVDDGRRKGRRQQTITQDLNPPFLEVKYAKQKATDAANKRANDELREMLLSLQTQFK
ncbi:hypothetical protein LIER_39990 [Lithospermum erythrorhizon]|uniref:Uncharacterized protein n=1 Tax=Lithospermum erythrorhizon TaxID=34254 RepID=A0AAV3QP59_LITER